MKMFSESADLKFGKIVEVSGTSIRVEIDSTVTELTRTIEGRVYPVGQLASVVKIHYGRRILFAYVRMLRMKSELLLAQGISERLTPGDDSRVLDADLFAEGLWDTTNATLRYSRGVETYPLPLQSVYLTTADELETLYAAAESTHEQETVSPMVPLGEYVGANGALCRANIDKLFGQHCAVLGSTGSGKSGTVAAILHSVLEHRTIAEQPLTPRIVLLDPHGEYAAAFGEQAKVYRAYSAAAHDEGAETDELRLPYWLMSGDELRGLIIGKTEAEATSQNNIVYKALKHSRMVTSGIVEALPENALGELPPSYKAGHDVSHELKFDRDKPIYFSLKEFGRHIDEVQGRKENSNAKLAESSRKSQDSLLDKLSVLESDPRLAFLMTSAAGESLQTILQQFIGTPDDAGRVCIIDMSGLPNEVAGPLSAAIARTLFNYKVWQSRVERERDPILLVCEEAHRYVPDRGEAQYRDAQDAIRRIAREGRKYGLGLMLVSQRPADVESTVLSQCNSWIVLRLTNGTDQEHVARFLPDSLVGLTKILSSLSRREAVFVGEAAALPARIKIRELIPSKRPQSADLKFSTGWSAVPLNDDELATVISRWTGIE